MDFDLKEQWNHRANHCLVQVSKHTATEDEYFQTGPHRWCVYIYLYPGHPRFVEYNMYADLWDIPDYSQFHGGISLFRKHYDQFGQITAVQIGCDYNHVGDKHWTHCTTKDQASDIFHDAEELFKLFNP